MEEKLIKPSFEEVEVRQLALRRVSKTVTGGRRMRISALCAVGDGQNWVGVGLGKAAEPPDAIQKAAKQAYKDMIFVKKHGTTIPHEVWAKFGAVKVMLKPASPGTGIIACDPVRNILELGGIRDILTKVYGSRNVINTAYAVIKALKMLRTKEEVERLRGVSLG